MRKSSLYFHCLFLLWGGLYLDAFSQKVLTVIDAQSQTPIDSVVVVIEEFRTGKQQQFYTDKSGRVFGASVPFQYPWILRIFKVGYQPVIDTVQYGDTVRISLQRTRTYMVKNVVVTAQYGERPLEESVYPIHLIQAEEITRQGAWNLRDALHTETNIELTHDNILGTGMRIAGIGGENVKILVDDVPVIGRQGGNIDLSQILLADVERIEVIEGPVSVHYGTNALGGVVNVITRKSFSGTRFLDARAYYETVGQYNIDAGAGVRLHNNQLSVWVARHYFDGWSPEDPVIDYPRSVPADSSRFKLWKPKEQYSGRVRFRRFFPSFYFDLSSSYFWETILNRGYPRAPANRMAFDERYRTHRWDTYLSLYGSLDEHRAMNLLFAYNNYAHQKNVWLKDLTTLEEHLTTEPSDHDTTEFDQLLFRGTLTKREQDARWNYQVGYDFTVEMGRGKRITDGSQSIGDYALFGSAEYTVFHRSTPDAEHKAIARLGLRYAYNTAYDAPIVPSLHLLYRYGETVLVRASYAHGFRAPSLKELYFEFVDINHDIHGNPELEAEQSRNFQLSIQLFGKLHQRWNWMVEPKIFYNDIENLIALSFVESPNRYMYTNIGRYRTAGASCRAEIASEYMQWTIGGSIYYAQSRVRQEQINQLIPEANFRMLFRIPATSTEFELLGKYFGETAFYQEDDTGETTVSSLKDYALLNFSIQQQVLKDRLFVVIGGKNLLNVQSIGYAGTPPQPAGDGAHTTLQNAIPVGWGRTYFVQLRFHIDDQQEK